MIDHAPWLFPLLALVPAAVLFGVRRLAASGGLALADAPALSAPARRTTLVTVALALVACLLVAGAALLVRKPANGLSALLPSGESTVIVLDMSASVSDLVYGEIARTLSLVSDTTDDSVRVGLVLFSDVAQVALPPGTKPRELKPFVRFFLPKSEPSARDRPIYHRPAGPTALAPVRYIVSPWFTTFAGGTSISKGLEAAREILARTRTSPGRVLLITDLENDAGDTPGLTRELIAYGRAGIPLNVVAVPPAIPAQREVFERVLSEESVIDSTSLRPDQRSVSVNGLGLPISVMAIVSLLALLLVLREPLAAPLNLGRSRERSSR